MASHLTGMNRVGSKPASERARWAGGGARLKPPGIRPTIDVSIRGLFLGAQRQWLNIDKS